MLDLDGTTILNKPDALPSQKVIEAVSKAKQKLSVCVATGRPLWRAQEVLNYLQIPNPVILLDGSQIIDGASKKLLYERPVLLKDFIKVLEILKPYHNEIIIDEKDGSVTYTPSYKPRNVFNFLVKNLTIKEADELIDSLSHIETIATHKAISWQPGKVILNISHAMATKQYAIFEVAKMLQINTHEIIGVGDGYNDFPLLMACGLKVAMGNAVEEIKTIADYIAPNVEQDGVADVIEKFIL